MLTEDDGSEVKSHVEICNQRLPVSLWPVKKGEKKNNDPRVSCFAVCVPCVYVYIYSTSVFQLVCCCMLLERDAGCCCTHATVSMIPRPENCTAACG